MGKDFNNNQNLQNYPDPSMYAAGSPMDFNNVYGDGLQQPVQPAKAPKNTSGNNMKKKLIILCLVGFGLLAILSAAILLLSTPKKYLGEWACQNYTDLIDEPNSPNIGFNLNEDGTFIYGQYGDLNNNHYSGSYKAEKANKASQNGEVYYSITFSPTKEFIDDGAKQDTTDLQMDPLEMSVLEKNGKKEATIKFDNLGSIYYCTAAK